MYQRRLQKPRGRPIATIRSLLPGLGAVTLAWSALAAPGDFPHWDGQACSSCHGEGTPAAIENYDAEAMCGKCHNASDTVSCRHPSDVAVGKSTRLPKGFETATVAGRMVCTTCHDPLVQCQGDKLAPYLNSRFLRGGPFRQADEACLLCHDAADYAKIDPHVQDSADQGNRSTCGYCHKSLNEEGLPADETFVLDVSIHCLGCHPVTPHPMSNIQGRGVDSWNHLVAPSESTLRRMDETRSRTGARLPVEPGSGKVTCATCHDPHEPGTVAGDPQYIDRARLRPVIRCENCHEK